MESMVERVAKAIYAQLREQRTSNYVCAWDVGDDYITLDGDFKLTSIARAAIEEMLEPTDMMGNGLPSDYRPGSHSATQIWRAMIVKALEE